MPHNHSMENNHNVRASQPTTVEIPSNKSQNKELIPPDKFSFTIGGLSFLGFLITTCVKLVPLAQKKSDALKEKEEAESKKNAAVSNTNAEAAKLAEARQRVIDLDCAISGYESFNGRVTNFRTAATNDPTENALDTLQNWVYRRICG